jgi:hypothetical protein
MKRPLIAVAITSIVALSSCSPVKKSQVSQLEKPVYEIAVRQVKDGMKADFEAARTNFIEILTEQKGVSNDREFSSFYALPEPDKREVFIGMTEYASYKTPGKVQSKMSVVSKFMKFKKTMDLKAYVFVQPIEGGNFDLGSLAKKPGQIVELAVRKVTEDQETRFENSRKDFVNWLNTQEGVVGSWEFKLVGGKDTEGLTVGMSVYESQDAFQAIAGKVQQLPEAGAYFSTFDPVALQYAVSIK